MGLRQKIRVAKLVQLYDFWDGLRRGRRFPSRQDFTPVDLGFILGNIDLIEISGDPPVLRFRLSGSAIDGTLGFTMQGKTLDEYPQSAHREAVRRTYLEIAASGEPKYEELDEQVNGRLQCYARLILPLSNDGVRVNMLMKGAYPIPR